MGKWVIGAGLLLASWTGLSGAVGAREPAEGARTAELHQPAAARRYGPYVYETAVAVANDFDSRGYRTKLVRDRDGYYWVWVW
jgi:hypothetical protein